MTKGNRTVAGLLAVVSVLLGLNVMGKGSTTAQEQGVGTVGPTQPTVVAGHVVGPAGGTDAHIWRFWSDGTVDYSVRDIMVEPTGLGCQLDPTPDFTCGPEVILPGTCPADVDHNGDVMTTDLLQVLGAWGPCE